MFWATLHLFCLYFCPPMNLTLSLLVFSRVGIFLKLQPHRASYSLPLTDHLLSHSAMQSTSQSWISAMYITSSIIRRGMSGTLCTFHVPGNALRLTIPLLLPSPNQRCSLRYAQSLKLLFLTPLPRTNVWRTDPVPPVPAQTDGLPFQVDSLGLAPCYVESFEVVKIINPSAVHACFVACEPCLQQSQPSGQTPSTHPTDQEPAGLYSW